MEPMKPMKPMHPMEPLPKIEQWWSENLGSPSVSGGQDGMRYAFFPDKKLLLINQHGQLQRFGTGEHTISGVSQVSRDSALVFRGERGPLKVEDLQKLTS
jgi:hypothetical protein